MCSPGDLNRRIETHTRHNMRSTVENVGQELDVLEERKR